MDIAVIMPSWHPERAVKNMQILLENSNTGYVRPVYVIPKEKAEASIYRNQLTNLVETPEKLGPLQAMAAGGKLHARTDLLMFLHDDVEILEKGWDTYVAEHFRRDRNCGLAGFGGATGLGDEGIYKIPYELNQLARHSFKSNMKEWQVHGTQTKIPERVAVLDGFCQIFSKHSYQEMGGWEDAIRHGLPHHHMYDAWAACRMNEMSYHVWLLPVYCHHHGGMTAVSQEYAMWVQSQGFQDDSDVHRQAHKIIYDRFRQTLPIRTKTYAR